MSNLEAAFKGAAGEIKVAKQLLDHEVEVFVPLMHSGPIDLVAKLVCGDLLSIQVKVAYEREETKWSFHAGEYDNVDYYAIIASYAIIWVPTYEVKANSHASLTMDMQDAGSTILPLCPSPICELERNEN